MIEATQSAGICGLFCGTCPMFPEECHGCLSDKLAPHCRACPNGFRQCVKAHGVTRCFECGDFPCERLHAFLDTHWENGISHHAGVIENLERMKAVGVAAWVDEETAKARCPHCGKVKAWNKQECGCPKSV